MSVTGGVVGAGHRTGLGAAAARWATPLLPAAWRLLRHSATLDEAVLATLGPIEVRRTRAGVVARTVVKGECEVALQAALSRLANYTGGDNREERPVPVAKPLVQRPGGPGRWLVQIALPGVYNQFSAPVPRDRKVRIVAQPTETLAVMRRTSRPQPPAHAHDEAAIAAALPGSGWVAAGPSVLRLRAPSGWLWTGGFEVAVPVTAV